MIELILKMTYIQREEINSVLQSTEILSKCEKPRITNFDEVERVIKKLNIRKAKDQEGWTNDIVVFGGDEVYRSLVNIFNIVDKSMIVPDEWCKMKIRVIDKKGSKLLMKNKRGLFLTNIVSKIYEFLTNIVSKI